MVTPRRLPGLALLALFTALAALGCDGEPVVGGHFDATVMKPEDRALPDAPDATTDAAPLDVALDVVKDADDGSADVAVDAVDDAADAPGDVMPRCTSSNDMCPVGQRCDDASGTCVPGCRNDEACTTPTDDAGARRARCDLATRACVECVTSEHCAAGTLCVGNQCVAGCNDSRPCPTGQSCCAGACVDLLANLAHCGACDARCATPNATASCLNGNCAVATCAAPFGNCDGMAANGCETNLLVDVGHCGGCGMMCPTRARASSSCAAGRCEFTCEPGFADCDMNPANGCETDTNTDVARCGSCRTACNPPNGTPACRMGACAVATCSEGFADCNMNPNDGCEADTRASTAHCGACGRACPTRPNAFPGCVGGMCVTSCVMGFQDCDGDAMNGCEADVRSDRANCGACGRVCDPAHATGACMTGRCTITACDTGFADCDMDASNGCEVNLQSDASHCAACGAACALANATPACTGSRCAVASCNGGFGDCDGNPANGCETNLTSTVTHCGACGRVCSLANTSAAGCAGGSCTVVSCASGFANCDGTAGNGCETNLTSDANHCGGCGVRCPSGSCRFDACVSFGGGFENSDPGCASCANGNPTTGGCSCPAGFGTTSRLRVINDCRGGGTQVGAVITMCGAPAAGDWGGAFQQDDGVGCNQGCRAPNPYTGGCACPGGMVGIAFRTIVDTPCRTLIGSNITYCALASGPRPTFGGAFQLDDNVPGAAGCRRPNPYTGGCSCPAGFGQSPLRVEVDTARGFIGSAIFLCTR